jgi:hypothetical protein
MRRGPHSSLTFIERNQSMFSKEHSPNYIVAAIAPLIK